jgi:hypothetical protein
VNYITLGSFVSFLSFGVGDFAGVPRHISSVGEMDYIYI